MIEDTARFESKDITVFDALKNIQKRKYILPAFQRQYVWNLAQVEKLWDSILIGYPISSFLFWHLDEDNYSSEARFCDFLSSAAFKSGKHEPANNKFELSGIDINYTDTAVLDGQQRLTSLFISLFGEAMIRQKWAQSNAKASPAFLYLELDRQNLDFYDDEDSSEHEYEYNAKRYGFTFTSKMPTPTQFKVKTLVADSRFEDKDKRAEAITEILNNRPVRDKEYAFNVINKLTQKIYDEPIIRYTELFGVTQPDALEIFVRFNSGGKALRRSEITMSILEAYWPDAKSYFNKALSGVYSDFGTDFIVRSALMLYGRDVKGEIDGRIARILKDDWGAFTQAMRNLADLLDSMNIKISHYCNSWNILIPALYSVRYNSTAYKETALAIKTYLVRASLFDYFKNGTTAKLQQMKKFLESNNAVMDIERLDYVVPVLRVSDAKIEEILDAEKGSRIAGETLYFLGLDWLNQDAKIKYDQDHLHPAEGFDKLCPNGVSPKDWMRWQQEYNKLPNLQYLSASDNRSKNQTSLYEYYYNELDHQRQKDFVRQGMIPKGVSLELREFGDFYEKRKELLRGKLRELLEPK